MPSIKSRRTSPTGDERHNERKSGPAADSLKRESARRRSGTISSASDVTDSRESEQQAYGSSGRTSPPGLVHRSCPGRAVRGAHAPTELSGVATTLWRMVRFDLAARLLADELDRLEAARARGLSVADDLEALVDRWRDLCAEAAAAGVVATSHDDRLERFRWEAAAWPWEA